MVEEQIRRGRLSGALVAVACALAVASCQSGGAKTEATAASAESISEAQPRMASYTCAGGASVTVENFGSSVRVVGPEGESLDLPASPSTQRNRYGEASDAIVLEGREALFMRRGHEPLACMR
jgi:membrane-bound inhibitor of C-type lysozyme